MLVSDRNSVAVAGDDIRVIVDDAEIGDYPITRRREKGDMTSTRADVPDPQVGRLSRLLRLGGELKVQTTTSTYSAPLAGMETALAYSSQCLEEAEQMETGHP